MARAVYVHRRGHPMADQWGMVDTRDLGDWDELALAINAPIMVDRFYENTRVVGTGEDIGSRRKHREYMKRNGLTTVDDYTQEWAKAAKDRAARQRGDFPDKRERREEVGRIWYELEKGKNAKR